MELLNENSIYNLNTMNAIREDYNKIFVCPNNNCINVPEISYSYELLNPSIKYKCYNSKDHRLIEEKMKLDVFLRNSSPTIQCSFCNKLIFEDEFILSKSDKILYHIDCLKKYGLSIDDAYIKINANYLLNYCLEHNKNFRFVCKNCKVSLCNSCDLEYHDDNNHTIIQIKSLRENKNKNEIFKSILTKQKALLKKIKSMNNKLIESLENDIIIKEQILENYENNGYNYQSILNFNNFELKKNEKYERILDDIVNKYDEYEKNSQNIKSEEIFINSILGPLYYSMMINDNSNFNPNINKLVNEIMNINEELNSKKMIKIRNNENNLENPQKDENKSQNINNNKENGKIKENKQNNELKIQEKNKKFNKTEIKKIKQGKQIFNMIILHTENIATSSIGNVSIYNSYNLLSPNEKFCLLQKIYISNDREISYVFEFPDETLLCSTYGKIYRLKLFDNDKKYNILGIIELEKAEIPSKLISFGSSILSVLTSMNKHSFIRLFIKNFDNNQYNDSCEQIDDNQSAGILNDYFDYLDRKQIEKDKDFYAFSENNNINLDQQFLCSIFEINNNNNENKTKYKFIVTSNSKFDNGEDKVEFHTINKINEKIELKKSKLKKIKISCSTLADTICQLNKQFICVGLQGFKKIGQKNGLAIINIQKKEIYKIIDNLPIYSLCFSKEKKLLYSAMDEIEIVKKNKFMINIYKVVEEKDEIFLDNVCKFKTKHKEIIVTLLELQNKNHEKSEDNNNFIASSSVDCTLRINKISI